MVDLFEMYEKTTMYNMYDNILADCLTTIDNDTISKYNKKRDEYNYYNTKPNNTNAQIAVLNTCYHDALEIYNKMHRDFYCDRSVDAPEYKAKLKYIKKESNMYNDPFIVTMKGAGKAVVKIDINILTKMFCDGISTIEIHDKKYDMKAIITCCVLALTPQLYYAQRDVSMLLGREYYVWLYYYCDKGNLLVHLPTIQPLHESCREWRYTQNMIFIDGKPINDEEE